jgi:hypothetical protein
MVEIMEEAMMAVEETFKLVGEIQNDTYEFPLIFFAGMASNR